MNDFLLFIWSQLSPLQKRWLATTGKRNPAIIGMLIANPTPYDECIKTWDMMQDLADCNLGVTHYNDATESKTFYANFNGRALAKWADLHVGGEGANHEQN